MFCLSLAVSMEQGPRDLWQEWASAPCRGWGGGCKVPSSAGLVPSGTPPLQELRCRWLEPVQTTPPALSQPGQGAQAAA